MVDDPKMTMPMVKALNVFMKAKGYRATGADLIKEAKLASGTVYPMLVRMEASGWVRSEWEDVDPSEVGRPKRKFFYLTGVGQKAAMNALTDISRSMGWAY